MHQQKDKPVLFLERRGFHVACVAGPGQAESREEDAIAAAAVLCAVAAKSEYDWVGFLGWRQLGREQEHRPSGEPAQKPIVRLD